MRRRRSTTRKSGCTCISASSSTGRSTDPSRRMKNGWSVRLGVYAGAFTALAALGCAAQPVIHEKASSYNTIIVTEDQRGMRTLLFERGGGRQSVVKPGDPDHLELPYARVALAGLALCEEPRRILVVGLGGGTLPMFLRAHYPAATIDVAEIDPEVVDVAKKCFGFVEDEQRRARVGEGLPFRPGRAGRVRIPARTREKPAGKRAAGRRPPVKRRLLRRDHSVHAEQQLRIGPDFFGSEAGPFAQFLEFGDRVFAGNF